MKRGTPQELAAMFKLELSQAKKLVSMMQSAQRGKEVDAVLDYADKLLEGHGVEAIRGENITDGYYGDIVALYVNMGDTYNATILFDVDRHKFYATSYGDWVEAYENSGRGRLP